LRLAVDNEIKTIAFPAISCGAYRFPVQPAAAIALKTTRDFLATWEKIDQVTFVLATDEILAAYEELLDHPR
jgi:O-acetyl-ADP-ribose deacetylase